MTMRTPTNPRLVEQTRLEHGAAAAAHERASRPRGLIVMAGLVLVIACVYALLGYSARSSALAQVDAERAKAAETARLVDKLVGSGVSTNAGAVQANEPDAKAASNLEKLAEQMGLGKVPVSEGESTMGENIPGLVQRSYKANLYNKPSDKLLAWMQAAQNGAPAPSGVQIARINLRPATGVEPVPAGGVGGVGGAEAGQAATGGWNLDIEFTRLERKQ